MVPCVRASCATGLQWNVWALDGWWSRLDHADGLSISPHDSASDDVRLVGTGVDEFDAFLPERAPGAHRQRPARPQGDLHWREPHGEVELARASRTRCFGDPGGVTRGVDPDECFSSHVVGSVRRDTLGAAATPLAVGAPVVCLDGRNTVVGFGARGLSCSAVAALLWAVGHGVTSASPLVAAPVVRRRRVTFAAI